MTYCCEPGCSGEVKCAVHELLDDIAAKVDALPVRLTDDPWSGDALVDWVRLDAVLALLRG